MTDYPSKQDLLRRLKESGLRIETVLDVGAHEQTVELRLAYPTAKHVLFEPAEDFHAKLHEHYAGMDYDLVPHAVSDYDGEGHLKKFDIDGKGVSHATLVDPAAVPGSLVVRTRRLDSVVAERGYTGPFLLKIDVDGFEIPILRGAERCLSDVDCIIIEATRETFVERLNFVVQRGFDLFDIVDTCYYYGVFSQADLVFLKSSIAQRDEYNPWRTREFSWDKWIPVASFEAAVQRSGRT